MAAYMIAEVEVTDPAAFAEYGRLVPGTIAAYGGKYIVRGGAADTIEGDWVPKRLVIIEFESLERARAWYNSEEYKHPKELRHRAARSNLVFVDGL